MSIRSANGGVAGSRLLFASNGALYASLLPWYPTLSDELSLSPSRFGLIVACYAVGSICSSTLPPRLIARWGPVPVSVVGTVVLAVAIAAVAWSPSGAFLALALFVVGVVDAVVDVGQNVAGVRAQDAAGRSVLSSMHAMWSLGGVAAGALATASAAAGVDMRLHLAVTAVLGIAVAVVGGRWIGEQAPAPAEDTSPDGPPVPGRWRTVAALALPLVAVALCGTVVEDVANNWAAVSGVQLAGLDLGVAGVAFTVAIGSQCIGRFTGDPLINRYGTVRVARVGGVLIAVGGVLIATAVGPLPLFLGFALAGYGTATLVPSALGAAARLPGIGQGGGVTVVSWLMRIGFLATSPVVGALADGIGLRWGLGILVASGVIVVGVCGYLGRAEAADSQGR